MKELFNNAPNLFETISKAIAENKELQAQVDEFKSQKAGQFKEKLIQDAKEKDGIKILSAVLPIDAQNAKDMAFQLRQQFPEKMVVAIGCVSQGKPSLTVALSDDLVKEGKNAGQIVREAGKLIQGGGGGQPHFATAGGKNTEGLKSAVDLIVELALA